MSRPSNGSHDHTGPATRATTDSILRRLNEESPYASMLHEELPDWLDIERRPTPRPAPRPVPKLKEKAVITETKPNLREADREFFREALITIGRGAQTLAVEECDLDYGNLQRWLDTGIGISAERLDRLMAWTRNELAADDPTARVRARWDDARCRMSEARKGVKQRGKPHPKTDLEEASRAEVAAALKRVGRGPCSVSFQLFRHTGMAQWLKTGKGLGAENVAKALDWARSVKRTSNKVELTLSLDTAEAEASIARVREGLEDLKPDPAAFVLETWAAARLTYAMETLGLTMPEGYRFRVTVERVTQA